MKEAAQKFKRQPFPAHLVIPAKAAVFVIPAQAAVFVIPAQAGIQSNVRRAGFPPARE